MKTLNKIITECNYIYGAPIGREDVLPDYPHKIVDIGAPHKFLVDLKTKKSRTLFDSQVKLDNGAYDKGGAYWGFPDNLRVSYTKDLSYVVFYRTE